MIKTNIMLRVKNYENVVVENYEDDDYVDDMIKDYDDDVDDENKIVSNDGDDYDDDIDDYDYNFGDDSGSGGDDTDCEYTVYSHNVHIIKYTKMGRVHYTIDVLVYWITSVLILNNCCFI